MVERRRLVRAFGALAQVALSLRFLGYSRCLRWLGRRADRSPHVGAAAEAGSAEALELARRHARAVDVAAGNVPFRARCLERSLTLWWLLRRRRMAAELRIGVRKSERDLEAHAWVELDGRVVNDRDDVHRRYAAFDGAGIRRAAPRSG